MAETTEETVSIQISVDHSAADAGIKSVMNGLDQLEEKVGAVSTSLKGMGDAAGLSELSGAISDLAKSGGGLESLSRGLSGLSRGLSNVSQVDPADIAKVGENIRGISSAMEGLNGTDPSKLESLASGLRGIGGAAKSASEADFGNLANGADSLKAKMDELGGAVESASQYGNKIKSLSDGLRRMPEGISGINSINLGDIAKLGAKMRELSAAVGGFGERGQQSAKGLNTLSNALSKLNQMGSDADALQRNLTSCASAISRFVSELNAIPEGERSKFIELANAVDQVSAAYKRLNSAQGSASGARQAASIQGGLGSSIASGAMKAAQAVSNATRNIMAKGWDAATKAAQAYLSVMGRIATAPLQGVIGSLQGIEQVGHRLLSMAASAVFYNGLFSGLRAITDGISAGIQNLYQWALITGNTFAATMNSMSTSMQYFQNSVGGAASELLDALAPALETVINWVVSLLNALNQLFAALTGHGVWRKAVRAPKSFGAALGNAAGNAGKAAKSTNKATKAVKDYENTVLGFDELNKLNPVNENNSGSGSGSPGGGGGGGGGAGVPDYGSMFEEAPIDDFYKQLANTDDWTALGKRIADGLNSWEKGIDWDRIDKVAATWSKRIWTAFNGFVHERDWTSFGYTVARGINVGLHFIDDIAQHADFTAFGAGLAGALNEAVSELDWPGLGRVMTDKLKISLDILHGFMRGDDTYAGFDFDKLRDKLTLAIDSAFGNLPWHVAITDVTDGLAQVALTLVSGANRAAEDFDDVIQGHDWVGWGQMVGNRLGEAVGFIDWPNLGRTLTDGLKVALEGLHGALQTFPWQQLGDGIEQSITAAFNNIDWAQAGTDINALANHILDVVEQAISAVNWDDIEKFLENLHLDQIMLRAFSLAVQLAFDGLGKAIPNMFENGLWLPLVLLLTPKVLGLGKTILDLMYKWDLITGAGNVGGEAGGSLIGSLAEKVTGSNFGQTLQWFFSSASTEGTPLAHGLGGTLGLGIMGAMGAAWNIQQFSKQMQDGFTPANFAGTMASAAGTGASIGAMFGHPIIGAGIGAVVGLTESLIANWGPISDWVSEHVGTPLANAFDTMGQNISTFVTDSADSWSNFRDDAASAWETTKENFDSQIVGPLGNGLQGLIDKFTNDSPQIGGGLKDGLDGSQPDVSASASSLFDTIMNGLGPTVAYGKEVGDDTGSGLSQGLDGQNPSISRSAQDIYTSIHNGISPALLNAQQWGRDTASNLSSGISNLGWRVGSAASGLASKIGTGVGGAVNSARGWGSDVSSRLGSGISSAAYFVRSNAGAVASIIRSALSSFPASWWGRDLMNGLANGIWNGVRGVQNAVLHVSNLISSFLHFSEPDVGPLSDFHTYMPDMMRQMARGIEDGRPLVTSALDGLTADMSAAMQAPSIGGTDLDLQGGMTADIANAVAIGIAGARSGEPSQSDRPVELVLRIDGEDIARATYRGMESLASRGVITADFA